MQINDLKYYGLTYLFIVLAVYLFWASVCSFINWTNFYIATDWNEYMRLVYALLVVVCIMDYQENVKEVIKKWMSQVL